MGLGPRWDLHGTRHRLKVVHLLVLLWPVGVRYGRRGGGRRFGTFDLFGLLGTGGRSGLCNGGDRPWLLEVPSLLATVRLLGVRYGGRRPPALGVLRLGVRLVALVCAAVRGGPVLAGLNLGRALGVQVIGGRPLRSGLGAVRRMTVGRRSLAVLLLWRALRMTGPAR
ncbi:hypothetical protein [Thermomonospora amylolytica]|uniref:hypothetical protein n=1 Tax=Thermomonospora amylolytica TaxID=1411117 RepID=UPI0013002C87|nr:hypothetical protein [Thermomonospora amylolytica]